jgi:hypothetical protein
MWTALDLFTEHCGSFFKRATVPRGGEKGEAIRAVYGRLEARRHGYEGRG